MWLLHISPELLRVLEKFFLKVLSLVKEREMHSLKLLNKVLPQSFVSLFVVDLLKGP